MKKIIYQKLEDKYIDSALECLIQSEFQSGTLTQQLEVDYKAVKDALQNTFANAYNTTIIAVDQNKKDYVCGVFPGLDLVDYIEYQRAVSKYELINLQRRLDIKLLQPLIIQNYQPGELLMGNGIGVREEYENQNIGLHLFLYFMQNAISLGFKQTAGTAYNPKSAHITLKLGGTVCSHIKIQDDIEIPAEYKKKIKINDAYVIVFTLSQATFAKQLLQELQIPKL